MSVPVPSSSTQPSPAGRAPQEAQGPGAALPRQLPAPLPGATVPGPETDAAPHLSGPKRTMLPRQCSWGLQSHTLAPPPSRTRLGREVPRGQLGHTPQPRAQVPAVNATGSHRQQVVSTAPALPGLAVSPQSSRRSLLLPRAQDKRGTERPLATNRMHQTPLRATPTHLRALVHPQLQGTHPLCSWSLRGDAGTAWPSACTTVLPRTQGRACRRE